MRYTDGDIVVSIYGKGIGVVGRSGSPSATLSYISTVPVIWGDATRNVWTSAGNIRKISALELLAEQAE